MALMKQIWLVRGSVSLGREGGRFEVSYAQQAPSSFHFLLSADQDVRLSTPSPLHVCLRATVSHHNDNGLNLWNVSHLNEMCFLYKSCHDRDVSS